MAHPNLSDEINEAIDSQAKLKGFDISKLKVGTILEITTTGPVTYRLELTAPKEFSIQGGKAFPEKTKVNFYGSTWGGSMMKLNWIGEGMHMELTRPDKIDLVKFTHMKTFDHLFVTNSVLKAKIVGEGYEYDLFGDK